MAAMLLVIGGCSAQAAQAASPQPIPAVLTLGQALSLMDPAHPELRLSGARLLTARAGQEAVEQQLALRADLLGDLRSVDKLSDPGHEFVDDSRVILELDKPLTRFGAINEQRRAAELRVEAATGAINTVRSEMRLRVMRAFFDVIIADYRYTALDEENALAYLAFDDARQEMTEYGEIAEVDVVALEKVYLDAYARRTAAANEQRASRLRLAIALNRPAEIPNHLVEPDLSAYQRPIPDYETLLAAVLEQNPGRQNRRLSLNAERAELERLSGSVNPTLGVRLQAAEYAEAFTGSRDQFRASLYLDIPLKSRSRVVEISRQNAVVLEQEAQLTLHEHTLRMEALNLMQRLAVLEREISAAESALLHAELDLDRVRLQYEMELRARIGSANWEVARAVLRLFIARYQRALVWERIDAMTGAEPASFEAE